ncbi:MAG: RdgB/HAM1 family non-canonical purine NTP pyrophosphatase [Acidobacteria bacterium]|nr:RdgB/HAM1 family non-canonical purine NTP pyrophosphatase [Acidobacteriota bacterium]
MSGLRYRVLTGCEVPKLPDPETLLVATFNPGKLREFQGYLAGLPFEVTGLQSLPEVPPSPEDGDTFEHNARQKASYYSRLFSGLTLADDSGLVVDALGGEPGVYSARFVSPSATDAERCCAILTRLQGAANPDRTARFVCCLALARQGKVVQTFEGTVEGEIARELRGDNGFGYDPIFLFPELNRTMAELSAAEKLKVSHRGQALRKMSEYWRSGVERAE